MFTINAGEAFLINLGTAISTNGEYVEVSVVFDGMSFVNFDENSMQLSIDQGVTTNDETGIYSLEITLLEIKIGLYMKNYLYGVIVKKMT